MLQLEIQICRVFWVINLVSGYVKIISIFSQSSIIG